MKAIIVEDNEANYILVSEILKPLGWSSFNVRRGREVAAAIAENKPDLIVMDISLPDADGLEITQQIRSAGCTIPVVVMSAHAFSEVRQRAIQYGANAFFPKPFDIEELENVVRDVTQQFG